jgi:mevalonate kinase
MYFSTRTNGKLLLTGEYFVTEGAVALALPTKLGQSLEAQSDDSLKGLSWRSYQPEAELWFEAQFSLSDFSIETAQGQDDAQAVAKSLQKLLKAARALNPSFLQGEEGVAVKTQLDFPRTWGLGSSATLLSMLADWAGVDAFALLEKTFGGSGYDLATAKAKGPVLFQKFNGKNRWETARFQPAFQEQLYFVHLNRKQSSQEALVHYMVTPAEQRQVPLQRISQITHNINAYAPSLAEFETLLEEHEDLVHSIVKQPKAKDQYFGDYWGKIKSLGAWGGDFVLATSNRSEAETKAYFQAKGFDTVLSYSDLIL